METTNRLRLRKPAGADDFKREDVNGNWDQIEAAPGLFPCTSTTRPTWTSQQAGRGIVELDTHRIWMWDGTNWSPQGRQSYFAVGSGDIDKDPPLTVAVAPQIIPGLVVNVSPLVTTKYHVSAAVTLSFQGVIAAARLRVDSTVLGPPLLASGSPADQGVALSLSQQWEVTVPAGAHSLGLYVDKSANEGFCTVTTPWSSLRVVEA